MKEALDSGKFGRILQIRTASGQAFATLRPAYREVYFAKPELGGGAINDMITHFYNVGDWLAGPIRKVMTDADHQILEGVTVEDTVHTLVRQGSNGEVMGSYARIFTSTRTKFSSPSWNRARHPPGRDAEKRWSWMMEPSGVWHHEPVEMPEVDVMYRRQNGAFLDAIEGSGDVLCSLEEAFRTLKVNLASHRSRAEGNWQTVVPRLNPPLP